MSTILLTGGKGFIGSHVLQRLCQFYPHHTIINIDAETYAARPPLYLQRPPNLIEEKVDIRDQLAVHRIMRTFKPDACVHMAAESHVCRSITGPKDFVTTNVLGTFNVLEEFRDIGGQRFIHISTDEVFGQIAEGHFSEDSPVLPRNPYAASKASSDLIVRSYHETYGMDVVIVRMANNFGPNQHSEKLIPMTINKILNGQPVTVHGKGDHTREWLYVGDAARGIILAMQKGKSGEIYCLPGELEMQNIAMVKLIHKTINALQPGSRYDLKIEHVDARPTDDCRYAMKATKTLSELEWRHMEGFHDKIKHTVRWYIHAMLHSGMRRSMVGA